MKKLKLTIQNPSPRHKKSSFLVQFAQPQTTKHQAAPKLKPPARTPKTSQKPDFHSRQSSAKATSRPTSHKQRPKRRSVPRPVPTLPISQIRQKSNHLLSDMTFQNTGSVHLNASLCPERTPRSSRSQRSKSGRTRIQTQTLLKRNSKDRFPITPSAALQSYAKVLNSLEQGEILGYARVYFLGAGAQKVKPKPGAKNQGYDDERGDYRVVQGDHIAYRYEVLGVLGSGSFGQVLKALDHKDKKEVALKVIRNKSRFHQQAAVEVKVLKFLKQKDRDGSFNIIHIQDHFNFRNHICLTFEILSLNLFDFLKKNDFQGLSLKLVRRFAGQLLQALRAQEEFGIIHCDLKPENILLKRPNQSVIKVIDYGSSCFDSERIYTYIQSRFYRAPEIMLGIEYTTKIDMWSFGCILAELYIGYPLFPGECEAEQLCCIMEVLGLPPADLLGRATRKDLFFDEEGPVLFTNSRGKKRSPGAKTLAALLKGADVGFVELVNKCLEWDPNRRIGAKEALGHEWVAEASRGVQPHQGAVSQARKFSLDRSTRKPLIANEKP